MKATVYRGIGDKHELIPFEAGKTIADCFDFDLSNAVILKNGLIANKDDILAEGDVLLIRDIPLAPVAIAAAVVATPFVVVGTVKLVGLVKDIQKAKQMQADAEKLSKSLKDEVKNIPYLRGAQNQIALGQTQPLILGQHLFTPYLATGTFSKIGGATGKDQFFYMVLQAGFAKTVIKELSCDDVILKKWDTDEPQQGVYNFDSGIFYDDENKIEVVQDGSPFTTAEFNKVIHTETPNTTIDKADSENYPVDGYVFTLPKNTMAVELCILFRGLICYASDGAKLERTVKIYPEYKIGNGAWTRFTFNQNGTASNTFSYMSLEQMRFVARKEFSFNEVKDVSEPILVRLLCDTARYEGSARDDVSLLWIQSEKYDKEKSINNFVPEEIVGSTERALSNLVGLKIKVTESNQDKLNKINMVLQSVAKTWNGSTWSVNKKPTRNPASLLLEVLTSDTHKASQIKESEIDLDSFGELYEYCEEKGFKFDIVLTEGQTKQEVCEMILEICNAILYKSITGLMTVAIDKPKENAIALFNSQNILSIENKKNIERKADGIKINYISRAGGYVDSSYLVMRDGQARTADSILIELNTQGMTEYEHIVKYARKLLASELLQPKQTIIEVGKEGIYYTPLSKVLLQHDSLKVGKGNAEVKSLIVDDYNVVGLKLYEPVEYDENETNGMIIVGAQNGAHVFYSLKYTALESFTDTVDLVEPIPLSASNKPQQGDILSYGLIDGEFAKITTEMLIIGSEPTEDGHRLTLVDYNEAVYETGAIPAYEPSFTTSTNFEATKPVLDGTPPPATLDDVANAIQTVVTGVDVSEPDDILSLVATAQRDYINVNWDWDGSSINNSVKRFIVEVSVDSGITWKGLGEPTTNQFVYYFDRATDGYPEKTTGTYSLDKWRFRVKAENIYGKVSLGYSPIASVNVQFYKTWIPPKPVIQVLNAIESGFEVAVSYDDASFYGSGKRLEFYVEGVKKEERGGIILFDRSVDGYPETAASRAYHNITTGKALDNFAVRAKLVTDENSGTLGDVKTPNVQYYKTWIPRLPSLALSVAGRKISLSIIPTNEVYGSIENRIQIRRYDEASYFALGNDDDAYTNETAYKQGAVNSYTSTFFNNYDQAVPLENQAAELPIDTSYYYRIQSKQSGFSDPVYTTEWTAAKLAIAKATSIRDITAKSIKQAQLANKAVTNRTIDDLAVDTDQLAIGAVVADRIASRTITAEQLSVVARNKINPFIHESDGLTGWTTGGEIVTVGSERALKLSYPDNPSLLSDPFDVQPDELLEFSFGLQCSREAEPGKGLYIGLTRGDTYEVFRYSWTDKKWNFLNVSTNAYFVSDYRSSTKKFFKTYILGYNIDITTVPSPQSTDESYYVQCLKLSSGKTQTRIRSGYNPITTPTFWYLFSPQVYQVGAGKIVAKQIDVKNLSAVSSKLGEIQGDTPDYKLVMGSGGSAEEGTLLLGATTDESYLRRWKENGIWKMALKLASFIVDAVSSKVLGQFEVKNSADTATHLTVDNTTGATIVSGGGDASLSAGTGRLLIGNPAGLHMTIDENEIMAKSNGTTASTLYLNNDGGLVKCGEDLEVAGGLDVAGDLSANRALIAKTFIDTGVYLTTQEGFLITTDIPVANVMTFLEFTMHAYGSGYPAMGVVQCYPYVPNNAILQPRYTAIGDAPSYCRIFYSNNKLCFWFPAIGNYTTMHPVLHTNGGGYKILSTTAEALPATRTWEVTANVLLPWSSINQALTGTPTAPTPATGTNNTQVATTAFVKNQLYEPNRGTGTNSIALGRLSTASENYSTALGYNATASENYSTALGYNATASGYHSTALGASSTASGYYSTALGLNSEASKINATALGYNATASENYTTAIGYSSTASGDYSIAIGTNASATRDYQITIGTKFVYLRFASTDTEATVYDALSPWVNPTSPSRQGAMGRFGDEAITRLFRTSSTTTISLQDSSGVKNIQSGNSNQIGSNLSICTVMY